MDAHSSGWVAPIFWLQGIKPENRLGHGLESRSALLLGQVSQVSAVGSQHTFLGFPIPLHKRDVFRSFCLMTQPEDMEGAGSATDFWVQKPQRLFIYIYIFLTTKQHLPRWHWW